MNATRRAHLARKRRARRDDIVIGVALACAGAALVAGAVVASYLADMVARGII